MKEKEMNEMREENDGGRWQRKKAEEKMVKGSDRRGKEKMGRARDERRKDGE